MDSFPKQFVNRTGKMYIFIKFSFPWAKVHHTVGHFLCNLWPCTLPLVVGENSIVMSTSVTPWTIACQAPLSMGILQARILEWVTMLSSGGILSTQGLNPGLLQMYSLPAEVPVKLTYWTIWLICLPVLINNLDIGDPKKDSQQHTNRHTQTHTQILKHLLKQTE